MATEVPRRQFLQGAIILGLGFLAGEGAVLSQKPDASPPPPLADIPQEGPPKKSLPEAVRAWLDPYGALQYVALDMPPLKGWVDAGEISVGSSWPLVPVPWSFREETHASGDRFGQYPVAEIQSGQTDPIFQRNNDIMVYLYRLNTPEGECFLMRTAWAPLMSGYNRVSFGLDKVPGLESFQGVVPEAYRHQAVFGIDQYKRYSPVPLDKSPFAPKGKNTVSLPLDLLILPAGKSADRERRRDTAYYYFLDEFRSLTGQAQLPGNHLVAPWFPTQHDQPMLLTVKRELMVPIGITRSHEDSDTNVAFTELPLHMATQSFTLDLTKV